MKTNYTEIKVESFIINNTSGVHGNIHIRPLDGQGLFLPSMLVECSKKLIKNYKLGTKFRIKATITSRDGGREFIYSHYSWKFSVIDE